MLLALVSSVSCLVLAGSCGSDERPPLQSGSSTTGNAGSRGDGGSAMVPSSWLLGGSGGGLLAGSGGSLAGSSGSANLPGGEAGSSGMPVRECTPSQDCVDLCAAYGPDPACGMGSAAQCPCICEERLALSCPSELRTLLQCVGSPAASINCTATGRIFESCVDESLGLEDCELRVNEASCGSNTSVCAGLCRSARLAFCEAGPETVGDCTCGCERSADLGCSDELDSFSQCAGNSPAFTCDNAGRPVSADCPVQWQAVVECLQLTPGDAGQSRPLFP